MADRPFRPTRPSAVKSSAAAEAAKLTKGKQTRLSIRVDPSTHRSIRRTAALSDKKIKRFVLDALAAHGVEIAEADRLDDSDDT